MATSPDFDHCARHERYLPEESMKSVSFPPVEEVAIKQISRRKVKCSFSASVPVEDKETIDSTARDSSSLETGSGFVNETENSIEEGTNMLEMFPGAVSVSVKRSEVSEKIENFGEKALKTQEIDSRKVSFSETGSGISGESVNFGDKVHKREEVDNIVLVSGSIDGTNDTFPGKKAFDGCNAEKEEKSVLGGKESVNFEEKEKEMKVKRCLEAEKKRLSAEHEVGTIFKANAEKATGARNFFKIDKHGNGCQEKENTVKKTRTMGDHLYPNHAVVGGSLKVEVIDDIALIDAVLVKNKGKDRHRKNIGEKPVDGKQAKRTTRKGKENATKMVEGNNNSIRVSDVHNLGQKNRVQLKMKYTRKQMEAMRFENIVDQRNLWRGINTGLAPEVVTEYEDLVCLKGQKNPLQNSHLRKPILKRDRAIGILGPVAAVPRQTHMNVYAH